MTEGKLKIASCQFAVSGSVKRNSRQIQKFMVRAGQNQARIVHFSECALSGYAGTDFDSFAGYDWELLKTETKKIMKLAAKLRLWVVLGSSHRLTESNKPHNSLYLINPEGKILDRYDKRFCTESDLEHYTPGDRFVVFTVDGVRCSLLICYDLRFPELYRELKKAGIDCIFQSFYNARQKQRGIHTDIMRQTMQCRAATNHFWISMTNSSAYYSAYPACFIQPDGRIINSLQFHRAGIMFNSVDLTKQFYDASAGFRELAIKGILTNRAKNITDPRSENRTIV